MNDWRDRLRKAVKRTGKKQCAIAEAAGVSQETLSRVLSGVHCEPKFETVARIVRATRESVAWLLDEPIAPLSADDLETVREAAELLLSRLPEPVEVDEEESPVVGSPPKISTVAVVTMKHGRVFAQRWYDGDMADAVGRTEVMRWPDGSLREHRAQTHFHDLEGEICYLVFEQTKQAIAEAFVRVATMVLSRERSR